MEKKIILLDTSVLIDYFRKKEKSKTFLFQLAKNGGIFGISSITEFEIYTGSNILQLNLWEEILKDITIFPFDSETSKVSAAIDKDLRKKRKQIDIPDLFIGATALRQNLPLATLNKKHFERVEGLKIILPEIKV